MYYSFTGKLGIGVNAQKYFEVQNRLQAHLNTEWSKGPLSTFEAELNCCPVIDSSDLAPDFFEPNEVDLAGKILFISFIVETELFNSIPHEEAFSLLSKGLLSGENLLKGFSATEKQVELFRRSLVFES